MSNFHDPLILTLSLPPSKKQTTLRLQVNISKGLFFHPDIRGLSLLSARMSEFDPHSCVKIEFYISHCQEEQCTTDSVSLYVP